MTKDNPLYIKQDPAWQLLAEFSAPAEPGSEDQPAERVTGAVRELGLQPAQVERIRQAIVRAMRKAAQCGNQEQHHLPVFVRIWVSGAHIEDPSSSGTDARQNSQRKHHSWGIFLIEKQEEDPQASAVESHHVVELYLYQEKALQGTLDLNRDGKPDA